MKKPQLLSCLLFLAFFSASLKAQIFFIHTTDTLDTFLNWSYLDHPFTNEEPEELVFTIHNANPGGIEDIVLHDHSLGVWYDSDKWSVFNEDFAALDTNISFNVLVPSARDSVFIHIADTDNIYFGYTYMDHPVINNNLDANIIITQNWQPAEVYQTAPIGIWFDTTTTPEKWAVFIQGGGSVPQYAAFNVLVADTSEYIAFTHTTTSSNKLEYRTLIDHPDLNDNPDAIILITQFWNPDGSYFDGVINPHEVGVQYVSAVDKWAIFNEDMAEMPDSASFKVVIEKQPEPDPEPLSIVNNPLTKDNISLNVYTHTVSQDIYIDFILHQEENITVQLYSVQGQLMETVPGDVFEAGPHTLTIDGSTYKAGYYLVTLTTKHSVVTQGVSVFK